MQRVPVLFSLWVLGWLSAALPAEPRVAVTLRSGFTLEADAVVRREGQFVLHLHGGEVLVDAGEIASMEALPSPVRPQDASVTGPSTEPGNPAESSVPLLIEAAANRHGLPVAFVQSVAEAESALNPSAVSPKGARGVMQLMPSTAEALGVNPDDPAENIEGGARLLRALLLHYQDQPDQVRRALAAYNAGSGAVQKYKGVPPYRETQVYIERVLRKYRANGQQRSPGHP